MRISQTMLLAMIAFVIGGPVRAQVDPLVAMTGDTLLKDLHGMAGANSSVQIEGNGYRIFVEHRDWRASQEAYAKTQKKVLKGSMEIKQDDPALPIPNRAFELRAPAPLVQTYYCVPSGSGGYWLIGFATNQLLRYTPIKMFFARGLHRVEH
jgi:hypothetical protein